MILDCECNSTVHAPDRNGISWHDLEMAMRRYGSSINEYKKHGEEKELISDYFKRVGKYELSSKQ